MPPEITLKVVARVSVILTVLEDSFLGQLRASMASVPPWLFAIWTPSTNLLEFPYLMVAGCPKNKRSKIARRSPDAF